MSRGTKFIPPALFLAVTASIGGGLAYVFFASEDKSLVLPGETTHGHYQIELRCDACHTDEKKKNVFTSSGVSNKTCISCHGEALEEASDSHPVRKFKNPENATFLEHIDAMSCVACHQEHNAKITGEMAVTVPNDYCAHCHQVTLENLESHKDLKYDSCATAGCHNYHDNMALAPSFLLKHFGELDVLAHPATPTPDALTRWIEEGNKERQPLSADDHDGPADSDADTIKQWADSRHAASGINCSDCHDSGSSWTDSPEWSSCNSCHEFESNTFLKGKHGMRLAHKGLSPMTPGQARQPMKADAAHRELNCNACHEPHNYDRKFAAYEACIQCHDDDHTRQYQNSTHYNLWQAELNGGQPGTGVSCATCHMPSVPHDGHHAISHDQNANLTPNEKMLRSVCMHCHGLQFSMDALADESLHLNNFSSRPQNRHPGIDWTVDSAVRRNKADVIELKEWLEANPGKGRSDFLNQSTPAKPDTTDTQ